MNEPQFLITEREENALIEAFSHEAFWDPDSLSKIYAYSGSDSVSDEALIESFIEDVLDGDYFNDSIKSISQKNAAALLRQMAMFEADDSGSKVKHHTPNEAKQVTDLLMDFTGPKAAFFTNVLSVENPHDRPGEVMTNGSDGSYLSISFWAINEECIIFIHQAWNYSGG